MSKPLWLEKMEIDQSWRYHPETKVGYDGLTGTFQRRKNGGVRPNLPKIVALSGLCVHNCVVFIKYERHSLLNK